MIEYIRYNNIINIAKNVICEYTKKLTSLKLIAYNDKIFANNKIKLITYNDEMPTNNKIKSKSPEYHVSRSAMLTPKSLIEYVMDRS